MFNMYPETSPGSFLSNSSIIIAIDKSENVKIVGISK